MKLVVILRVPAASGQRALAVPAGDHAIRHPRHHRQHIDLQHIARLSPLDRHRAGNDMRAVFGKIMRYRRASNGLRILQHHLRSDTVRAKKCTRVPPLVFQQTLVRERIEHHNGT